MIRVLDRSGIQETCLIITKAIYSHLISNIKLNGEKLKETPLKLGTKQGCSFFPNLFNIVLEVLASAIRQQKEIKEVQFGKKKSKYLYLNMK